MVSFFFFKQKTAYEVRISDWSSDVCSSDLYIGLVYVNVESNLIAAAYTTLVFLVRLLVLCLTLPLFLMAAFVGLVDGLVRRDIRRFGAGRESGRSEEHTSELQSLMRISYAVFCLQKKKKHDIDIIPRHPN